MRTMLMVVMLAMVFGVARADDHDDHDDDDCNVSAACAAACSQVCNAVCPPPVCPPPDDGIRVSHCRHFRRPTHGPSKGQITARCWITP